MKRNYIQEMAELDRQRLIKLGIIIEDSSANNSNWDASPEDLTNAQNNAEVQLGSDYTNADYDLQNEIIRFFINNPEADPELFRQFAVSLGIEPDELQYQANILLSQLLKIYTADSENLGYGDSLTSDEVSDDVQDMLNQPEA